MDGGWAFAGPLFQPSEHSLFIPPLSRAAAFRRKVQVVVLENTSGPGVGEIFRGEVSPFFAFLRVPAFYVVLSRHGKTAVNAAASCSPDPSLSQPFCVIKYRK